MSTNHRSMQDYDQLAHTSTHYDYGTSSSSSSAAASSAKSNGKVSLDDFIYELKQRNEEMVDNNHYPHLNGSSHYPNGDLKVPSSSSSAYLNGALHSSQTNGHSSGQNGNSSSSSNHHYPTYDTQHLLGQLAQKEKDLVLAAELGKALLDRNEELTRTNEQINEEYTRNLEQYEQEKYALRKRLNSIEIEYENKIHDLQSDVGAAREKLNVHLEISKQNEAENSRIIGELTEQNTRLTNELKKTSQRESLLEKEIQSLKEQYQARRTNVTDHIGQLEGLRDEINLLSRRKHELESKISSLNEEKDSISMSLDESQYRILSLEKQLHEKDHLIGSQQKDLDELRRLNTQYQNRIDNFSKMRSFEAYKMQGSSLFNEIEMSSHSSGDDIHLRNSPNYFSEEDIDSSPDNMCFQCAKHKQELFDAFNKLKSLYEELYRRRVGDSAGSATASQLNVVSSNSNHDSGIQANLSGIEELNYVICDIQELIKSFDFMQCITCQEFNSERSELERVRKENNNYKDQLQKLNAEVIRLTASTTLLEAELATLKEENAVLKGDVEGMATLSPDEIVKRAWKTRDDTIARKKTVEIELAKIRIELMHVNSQLLETIQQKVELSQQLEQWQVDMEQLIEEQLKNKLSLQEKSKETVTSESTVRKESNLFDRIRFPKLLR